MYSICKRNDLISGQQACFTKGRGSNNLCRRRQIVSRKEEISNGSVRLPKGIRHCLSTPQQKGLNNRYVLLLSSFLENRHGFPVSMCHSAWKVWPRTLRLKLKRLRRQITIQWIPGHILGNEMADSVAKQACSENA